ncbi:hypothetical protein PAXRUDRAFT_588324 [Paxillus rubicundulus Ve08.2h10]|uniref:Uncharacterized protein n=1 Tax=Paxillus rubicundulus Ve08.2h10 TaxID=930991 RepID=A0A0D0DZ70_9AGAM|nr:hypothetical protein PAXRUDRAFT_588324 [Paxillus rubicundulus Ve08.2h10]
MIMAYLGCKLVSWLSVFCDERSAQSFLFLRRFYCKGRDASRGMKRIIIMLVECMEIDESTTGLWTSGKSLSPTHVVAKSNGSRQVLRGTIFALARFDRRRGMLDRRYAGRARLRK